MANEKLREEVAERRRIEDHLRRSEEELRERGDQLSRANADLGLFAFLVSHELQEPVRKTIAFGELLARAEAGTAQERQPHIRRMQDAARRMQRLVNDIMALCRVTAADKPLEPVELDAVLKAVAEEFGPLLSRAGGELRVEPLPRIRADPSQMRALFANLVSNAHKFRSKDRPPLVSISAGASEPGFVDIVVADNGIGFEERYRERIFKPFERLHRKGEYEGSGMGLAICERILMRHGGNIKAESRPGEGSRFIVTLPA